MNKFLKILLISILSTFISGQFIYADSFGNLSTTLSKIGSRTLDKMGNTIKPIKNATGNFVTKHTTPAFGNKVKNSSWRNVFTSSSSRKQATGILKGATAGFLSKDPNHGASIAYDEAVHKSGMTGIQKTRYISEDFKKNYDIKGPSSVNNSTKMIYETIPTNGSRTTSYFRVNQKTMDKMHELNLR